MNLNPIILGLRDVVGVPVEPDIYLGEEERYIVFTYEDERASWKADNNVLADTASMQVSYYCPYNYDYMADKEKIRDYLEEKGFVGIEIQSWIEDAVKGVKKQRHTDFTAEYTERRK